MTAQLITRETIAQRLATMDITALDITETFTDVRVLVAPQDALNAYLELLFLSATVWIEDNAAGTRVTIGLHNATLEDK